jgi:hypothetical protein
VASIVIREIEASWQTVALRCGASEVGGGIGGRETGSMGDFMSIAVKIGLTSELTTGGGIYLNLDTM